MHLAVLFYLLMVGREFIGLYALSPGWVSVRVLAWLTAALSAVASVLMWLNVARVCRPRSARPRSGA